MNKLVLQRILVNRYKGLTVKLTSKNIYYYHNNKLVGIYDLTKNTGVML